ncbi:hypothetical protein C7964_1014 [Loktanella sp. PT4BL]|jgi:hypothetical protein|uniref:hypothetical protein n=1 Tax=Loktanella sp. PT4BL TaxID=2135611 RepID=UPI000D754216|nr:hypothetical protein [Loktanella sp. PT4BL]PXW71899.1 hypothetical protein C7964_1014 [Loktanella sp. PT4BL]
MTREEFHLNAKVAAAIARSDGLFDAAEALEKIALSSYDPAPIAGARSPVNDDVIIKHQKTSEIT